MLQSIKHRLRRYIGHAQPFLVAQPEFGSRRAGESVLEPLSQEQVRSFRTRGYVVFESGLSTAELDAVGAEMRRIFADPTVTVSHRDEVRLQDAWQVSDPIRSVATSPLVRAILQQLYGRRPMPFQTLNFRVGTQQKAHSDTIHFNSTPQSFMCGAWLALEDVDKENGPLVYYPGSHLLPEFDLGDIRLPAKSEYYGEYENLVESVVKQNGLQPEYGILKRGQILVWSSNLLHGGSPITDSTRTRFSQVTHYFFEDCRYYTPMHSTIDNIEWRNPVPIV